MTTQSIDGESRLDGVPDGVAKLLREWRKLAGHKAWEADGDCCWWYGERASVSQLAGAAWTMGGWAMQEYAWTRGAEESHARIDLAVEHKSNRLRFIAEAKQIYPHLTSRRDTVAGAIESAFHEAEVQLRGVPRDDWDRVALVFMSPYVENLESSEEKLNELSALLQDLDDASVWTFPPWARRTQMKSSVTEWYYPGAVLLARHTPAPVRR